MEYFKENDRIQVATKGRHYGSTGVYLNRCRPSSDYANVLFDGESQPTLIWQPRLRLITQTAGIVR